MYMSSSIFPLEVETENVAVAAVHMPMWHSSFKTLLTFFIASKIHNNMVRLAALIYSWGNAQKVIEIT